MSNTPNLSIVSDNEWGIENFDDYFKGSSSSNNTPTTTTDTTSLNIKENTKDSYSESLNDLLNNNTEVLKSSQPLVNYSDETSLSTKEESLDNKHIDLAIDLIKSLDLIRIPKELDNIELNEEGLKTLVDETNKEKEIEFVEYMRSQIAHDPYMQDVFEYTLAGGNFADLPYMQQMTQAVIDYENIDLTDELNQQNLVFDYMSEGLNPANPRDKSILDMIPNKINQLTQDMLLRDEAINAQNYFIDKVNIDRNNEYQRAVNEKMAYDKQVQLQKQKEQEWEKAFVTILSNKKWSDEKKTSIGNETKYVQLDTNETIPLWEYKQRIIFSNPEFFQEFLDFTSTFNIKDMKFNTTAAVETTKVKNDKLQKIVDRINNKSKSTSNNGIVETVENKTKKQNSNFNPANEVFAF